MSSTGGQAGRTWRLMAVAAVVGVGTWVVGTTDEPAATPSLASSTAIAQPAAQNPAPAATPPAAKQAPKPRIGLGGQRPRAGGAYRQTHQQRHRLKVLYLTFDDGPSREWTPEVLAVLEQYGAKATFFQLGRSRRMYPGLARRVRADGHVIANHSTTHRDLTKLSDPQIRREVRGGPSSPCFRPPYGAVDRRVKAVLHAEGVRDIVLWDIDTLDWTKPGAPRITEKVVHNARPGRIVLLHDGGANRSQTVAALDDVLRELYDQGYVFRSLPC